MGVITESMVERHTNATTCYQYYNLCLIPTKAIIEVATLHYILDSKTVAAATTASLLEFTALAADIRLDMAMSMGVGN